MTVFHPSIGKRAISYACSGSEVNAAAVATGVAAAITADTGLGAKGITAAASAGVVTVKFPYLVSGDVHPTITTASLAGPPVIVSLTAISPVMALIAGILILMLPCLLNYIVASI